MSERRNIQKSTKRQLYPIILLVLSGEAIFMLPFVLVRIFRPTYLEVYHISNTELGNCFSLYGVIALLSYFFGGGLADRYSPKILIALSLILTGLGGIYLSTVPSIGELYLLYAFWGFTTIFLFWAPMIKATRIWGGNDKQGIAFGILEGGRGLVAATLGLFGVWIFQWYVGDINAQVVLELKEEGLTALIGSVSVIIIAVGVLVFTFFTIESSTARSSDIVKNDYINALKMPQVWLMMLVVLCGYVGYKMTDIIPQYAADILNYNAIESAQLGTYFLYLRPLVALTIGFLAQTFSQQTLIKVCFILMAISAACFMFFQIDWEIGSYFYLLLFVLGIAIYGVRTLYFALMEFTNVPMKFSGAVIGIISVIGFTPDIFMGPLIGYYLDGYDPAVGYRMLFFWLTISAIVGLIASFLLRKSVPSDVYNE
jgi:sugar phosphate permease